MTCPSEAFYFLLFKRSHKFYQASGALGEELISLRAGFYKISLSWQPTVLRGIFRKRCKTCPPAGHDTISTF